ncbi:MAG: tetratricopeptide repeat protein [Thiobacillaceae bacterium]
MERYIRPSGGPNNGSWERRLGDAVEQNDSEAFRCYQRAANAGDPFGQNNLGTMHLEGMGTARNPVEAVKWRRLAAEQGLAVGLSTT